MDDERDTDWLLGLAKISAMHIISLIRKHEDGELGVDGVLEAIRAEAQHIIDDTVEPA